MAGAEVNSEKSVRKERVKAVLAEKGSLLYTGFTTE